MLPIVDTNWSPQSHKPHSDYHVLRAVAVQGVKDLVDADKELAALSEHATTPGLGGLPNSIVAYWDCSAPDALLRLEQLGEIDRVMGVHLVLTSFEPSASVKTCIEWLATNQATVDVCGDTHCVEAFIKFAQLAPSLNLVCDVSQCALADKPLAVNEWVSFASTLREHRNHLIKITRAPVIRIASEPADSSLLALEIEKLTSAVGIHNMLFGSSINDQAVWPYFDAATRWASAHQRDQLFRQNAVSFYSL